MSSEIWKNHQQAYFRKILEQPYLKILMGNCDESVY